MFRFGHFRTFRYKNPLHVNPRKIKNSDRYEQSCSWKWKQNYSGMLQAFFLERESVSRVPSSLCTWLFQYSKGSVCVCVCVCVCVLLELLAAVKREGLSIIICASCEGTFSTMIPAFRR